MLFGKTKEEAVTGDIKVAHITTQRTRENLKVFIFKDEKSNSYGLPILYKTRGLFIRDIQDELMKGQTIWSKHPQDFSVFEVGEYDEQSGLIINYETKNCIGLVSDFKLSEAAQ